jgi:hypothetical protein
VSLFVLGVLGSGLTAQQVRTVCKAGPPECGYSDFQLALNDAEPGDTIELRAGETFPTTGGFALPAKNGDQFITVRSSAAAELPEGHRVTPHQAHLLARLEAQRGTHVLYTNPLPKDYNLTPDTDRVVIRRHGFSQGQRITFSGAVHPEGIEAGRIYHIINVEPDSFQVAEEPDGSPVDIGSVASQPRHVVPVEPSHHYRFVGIEIAIQSGLFTYHLLTLGGTVENAVEQLPYEIHFDRVYIHGNQGDNGPVRCVSLQGSDISITNSWIAECKFNGNDSQGIWGNNGTGPYLIENNYIEAAGENIMFGGAFPALKGAIPSDIKFLRNHVRKKLEWRLNMSVRRVDVGLLEFVAQDGKPCSEEVTCWTHSPDTEQRQKFNQRAWVRSPKGKGTVVLYARADGIPSVRHNLSGLECAESVVCEQVVDEPLRFPPNVVRLFSWPVQNDEFGREGTRQTFVVKNHFEVKNGQRMLIEGNIMENAWWAAQLGCLFVFTPRASSGEKALTTWAVAQDITIRNNWLRHANCAGIITGRDDGDGNAAARGLGFGGRVKVENNLITDVNWYNWAWDFYSGSGTIWALSPWASDVSFEHNTIINADNYLLRWATVEATPTNFVGNLVVARPATPADRYPPWPQMVADGIPGWTRVSELFNREGIMMHNVIANPNRVKVLGGFSAQYPPTTYVPEKIEDIGFAGFEHGDYRLRPDSRYSARCSRDCVETHGGRDFGANLDQVRAWTEGVVDGLPMKAPDPEPAIVPAGAGSKRGRKQD